MNPKFRPLYLTLGVAGLLVLLYNVLSNLNEIDLVAVLAISIPDMFFFYLAYKTYPADVAAEGFDRY